MGLGDDWEEMKMVELQGDKSKDNDNKAAAPATVTTPVMDPSARASAIFYGAYHDFAKIVAHYKRKEKTCPAVTRSLQLR